MTDVAEILERYLAELRRGARPDADDLVARHPECADELRAGLASLDFIQRAGPRIESDDGGPGRELGDFRIVREVGRGGMGVVYEAEQISLGRRVALKVLPFAAVLDPKQLQRFRNEAHAAANLHHTSIVPVYGVGSERGVHYYAMQFIEGESLAVAIGGMKRGGDLGPSEAQGRGTEEGSAGRTPLSSHSSNREPRYLRMAARLGVQAAEALDHAHQLGVVHRDIKPANLLVDAAGSLWITDFGLARSRSDAGLTMTGELLGTLRYMSPEQALAKRVPIDHRTDIYSLGATLYELFTLELAFPGDEVPAVIHDIAFKDPVSARRLNPALPADLETILLKAMAKDAARRYETAQEMADDLRRFLGNEPIRARPPTILDHARKWARRHRTLVAGGAAMVLLLLAGSAVSAVLIAREQGRTQRNFELAEARREQAERDLAVARNAIDEMLAKVGSRRLRDVPGLEPVRRELLVRAKELYQDLLARHGDEPEIRQDVATAHVRLGQIHFDLGEMEAAEREYDEAVARLERLVADFPEVADYRWRLGAAQHSRGGLFLQTGQLERAEEEFRDAIAHGTRLSQDEPSVQEHVYRLATTHHALGRVLAAEGRDEEAETAARRALELCEDLIKVAPADSDYRSLKAMVVNSIGAYLGKKRLHQELAETNLVVVGLADGLVAEFPRVSEYRELAGAAHLNLGTTLSKLGRRAEAVRETRRSLELCEGLARDFPSTPSYGLSLARSRNFLAERLRETGELAEAEGLNRSAVELLEGLGAEVQGLPEYQDLLSGGCFNLAKALRARGLLQEAEQYARRSVQALQSLDAGDGHARVPGPGWAGTGLYRDKLHNALTEEGQLLQDLGRLEDAEKAYRASLAVLEKDGGLDPAAIVSRAGTVINLGNLLRAARRPQEAEEAYRGAVEELRTAIGGVPEGSTCHGHLATGCRNLALLLAEQGRRAEAAAFYEEAASRLEPLSRGGLAPSSVHRDVRDYLEWLATCHQWLQQHYAASGRAEDSKRSWRALIAAAEELVRRYPKETRYGLNLGLAWRMMGWELRGPGESQEAEEALRSAIRAHADLVRLDRAVAHRGPLADSVNFLGVFLLSERRPGEAECQFREALDLRRALCREDPKSADYESELAGALHNWANALAAQETVDRVPELYEEAIRHQRAALEREPRNDKFLRYLSLHYEKLSDALLRLGDHARAAAAAAGLAETNPESAPAQYKAGHCLVWSAEQALKDERLDAAERARVAKAYAVQAKPILVRATELAPGEVMHWVELGAACVHSEDWKGVIAALGRDLGPGEGAFEWFLLATAHARLGRRDEARRWYDKAVAWMEERGEESEARIAQRAAVARLLGLSKE